MPPESDPPLLLDTHVWLWLLDGREDRLSARALRELRRASWEGRLLVAVISVWELAMLVARGRLRLAMQIEDWVGRALGAPGIRLAELTPRIAIESTRLPVDPPRDPADRILLATALVHGARLATSDGPLLSYAERGGPGVLDTRP